MEMEGLLQCSANYVPLSPISFLERAAFVYRDRVSIIYGCRTTYTWRETHERCSKLASALSQLGIRSGNIVAAMAPNVPALYELHFGVPMAGGVLSPLNPLLDSLTLTSILKQLNPKSIFVDTEHLNVVLESFDLLSQSRIDPPLLILIRGEENHYPESEILDYNKLLSMGRSDFKSVRPNNECDAISVNFTSGSTGNPKGVVYSHRSAYLNSLAGIIRCEIKKLPVFLWTVDMFRCNGWCLIWAIAAMGGTNICVRNVSAGALFHSISLHGVTHLCGPPTLLTKIADSSPGDRIPLTENVSVVVAGTLPGARILAEVEKLGFRVIHGYGMTEALGPVTAKTLGPEKSREGIHNLLVEEIDVKDPVTMIPVPADGKTTGEVMLRGNTLMSGYLKNQQATQEAFKGGWYRTGDIGIKNEDGFIEIKDRAADMVISGGVAISSLEIEALITGHPLVMEAAVVGKPDDILGEKPCAFVKLRDVLGSVDPRQEIVAFCSEKSKFFMDLEIVIVQDLPLNSTGKIQKFVLRQKAKATGSGYRSDGH